jgi:hypothetical protein
MEAASAGLTRFCASKGGNDLVLDRVRDAGTMPDARVGIEKRIQREIPKGRIFNLPCILFQLLDGRLDERGGGADLLRSRVAGADLRLIVGVSGSWSKYWRKRSELGNEPWLPLVARIDCAKLGNVVEAGVVVPRSTAKTYPY